LGRGEKGSGVRTRWPVSFATAVLFLFLYLPLAVVVLFSFNRSAHSQAWSGFSTGWYRALARDGVALSAVRNSLTLAAFSSAISTVLGTLLGYGMYRSGNRRLAEFLQAPICLPDIVQAASLLLFFSAIHERFGIFGLGMGSMIVGHVTFQIPFVAMVVRARCGTLDRSWDEAARDLGASPWQAFWHVTLPMLRPGIVAGAMLAFTLSLDDFIVSFFTGGAGSTTLPVLIYSSVKRGISPEINALSTLLIAASVVATILLTLSQKTPAIPLEESELPK
jgi:spermidine/putrescine transport system permease protein